MGPKLQIRPAVGLKVRDPQTLLHIPSEGAEVERSTYWARRLASGDVVLITQETSDEVLKTEKLAKNTKSKIEETKP